MLSGLRNFFFALFISVIIFGTGAWFLVGYINKTLDEGLLSPTEEITTGGLVDEEHTNNTVNPDDEIKEEQLSEFTLLVLGIDDGRSQYDELIRRNNRYVDKENDEKKEADSIFLLHINPKDNVYMISSLPSDMKTLVDGYSLRLGAVYTYGEYSYKGMELVVDTVEEYTRVEIDYCIVVDYKSVESIINSLGSIEYIIPEDMYFKPLPYDYDPTTTESTVEATTQSPIVSNIEETTINDTIEFKKGKQIINGEKAIQLLRYNSYLNGSRTTTQTEFIKEVARQLLTIENIDKIKKLYDDIQNIIIESNINKSDFEFDKYEELILAFSSYTCISLDYPEKLDSYDNEPKDTFDKERKADIEAGIEFFYPDILKAIERYKIYQKIEN